MRHEIIRHPDRPNVTLECFILSSDLKLGQDECRPAVIVCPGGGYVYLSPRESEPVAMAYCACGLHAFVLNYSIGREIAGYAPLADLEWAIDAIRSNAEEWHVDKDKIVGCGFSAGGHLVLAEALMGQNKLNGMILGYPAVRLAGSGLEALGKLLTGYEEITEEENQWFDLTNQVTGSAPPLFVFTTGEDKLTRRPVLDLAAEYYKYGLACEVHLFQKGEHGLSLAKAPSANGSIRELNPHVAKWLDLSVEWLFSVFGEPEFADFSTSHMQDAMKDLGLI